MFNVTVMFEILPFAGIPPIVKLWLTPLAVLSGTAKLMVPDAALTLDVDDDEATNLTAGSPRHIVTELGVMVGAGGV